MYLNHIVMNRNSVTLLLFVSIMSCVIGQEVLISPDVSIKNDKKYMVLGQKGDNTLLFRDQINKQHVDVFDNALKYKYTRELELPGDNKKIFAVEPHGDYASIIYGCYLKDSIQIRQFVINSLGELDDTIKLATVDKRIIKDNFKYAYSEDETKLLLFNKGKEDQLNLFMIDLEQRKLNWDSAILIDGRNDGFKFKDMVISNEEEVFMLYEKGNSRYLAEEHELMIYHTNGYNYQTYSLSLPMPNYLSKDVHLTYDETNNKVLVLGLYTEANRSSALGYFYFQSSPETLGVDDQIIFSPFELSFIEEVNGKRKGINNTLDYYFIKEIVFNQDGGFIWIGEMYKKYVRRAPSPYGRSGSIEGFIDHYTEDVIVFAVDKHGVNTWKNVIYKKQFSQDDDAVYSSFFLMKTPSRLQLLFNDEIKKYNTVSGYSLDPIGNIQRKTLLNTEYENLKLRFIDALQVDSNAVLLTSEGSGVLNLVKISL